MRRTLPALAVIPLLCAATIASAQQTTPSEPIFIPEPTAPAGFSYTASALATTRFDPSDAFDHIENELELFLEAEFGGGFHTGLLLTSLYDNPVDEFEYEFTFGYGSAFANGVTWDLSYGYIALNDSAADAHEITGTLGFPLAAGVDGAVAVIYDPETEKSDQEFGAETALTDSLTLFGLIDNSDRDDNIYGELGVNYALTDSVYLQVLYEDTNDGNPLLGFSVGYEFSR